MGYRPGKKRRGVGELVDFPKPHPPISRMVSPMYRKTGKGVRRPARRNKELLTKFN